MEVQKAEFHENIREFVDRIDESIRILTQHYDPRTRPESAEITKQIDNLKQFLKGSDEDYHKIIMLAYDIRTSSIQILDKVREEVLKYSPDNPIHVKTLNLALKFTGHTIIKSSAPIQLIDADEEREITAQENLDIISLSYTTPFGDMFDFDRFNKKMIMEGFFEFIDIVGKNNVEVMKTGNFQLLGDAFTEFFKDKQERFNWSLEDLSKFFKGIQPLFDYITTYTFFQILVNEGTTVDTLNNPISSFISIIEHMMWETYDRMNQSDQPEA